MSVDARAELAKARARDSLETLRAQQEPQESTETTQQPVPLPPSQADAAMRGVAKGATFGLADEAYGALGALANPADIPHEPGVMGWIKGIPDRYAASRDYAREKDAKAQEAHPVTFGLSEAAGTMALPVSAGALAEKMGASRLGSALGTVKNALVAPEGAGVLANVGRGVTQGALFGAGNSTAHPFTSPDEMAHFAEDVAGGGALGGGTAGAFKIAGMGLSKLAPDSLKQLAEEQMIKAAGGEGGSIGRAGELLGQADEAGGPVVGWGSKAKDIAKAARDKQAYYEKEAIVGPSWRPFGGSAEKEIGGGLVDSAGVAEADMKAKAYQKIANAAEEEAQDVSGRTGRGIPHVAATMMASTLMHGGSPTRGALQTAAVVGGRALTAGRMNAFAGRAAQGLGEAVDSAGQAWGGEVGTNAAAANQFLQSGPGAQVVTHALLGSPESAADIRRQRLRDAMIRQLGAIREQRQPLQLDELP